MCDVSYDDCERVTVWTERTIKRARKAHRCRACGTRIEVGETYHRRFYIFEGYACDEPCCDACWQIAEAFGDAHELTPCPSNLLDYVAECADENPRWREDAAAIRRRIARNKRLADGVSFA